MGPKIEPCGTQRVNVNDPDMGGCTNNRPLSRGGHFVLGDFESIVYARLASFSLRG